MDGFLDLQMRPWQRAMITRFVALGPSLFIALATVDDPGTRNTINEWLNILQSIQLPFAIVPVLSFTASAAVMGSHQNKGPMLGLSLALTMLVLGANVFLVWDYMDTHPVSWEAQVAAVVVGLLYFSFVSRLAVYGYNFARESVPSVMSITALPLPSYTEVMSQPKE